MTNYSHGHDAEKIAAAYLKKQGYKILELNWRHTKAEIDIVAQKRHGPLTFVEVKYRQNTEQGSGLDYITPSKLRQMGYAAALYVQIKNFEGEHVLAAVEISGEQYEMTDFIAELS